ncbi:MAG: transglutaminase-like domain-containing protein [Archaeoglobaceae archaeon]
MKRLFLILVPLILAGCLSFELSREEYCNKAWRWDLECALNATLNDEEVAKVKDLSIELKGKDCIESSWNVLQWIEENIEYDNLKAQLPTPSIMTRGKEVIVQNPDRMHQTPIETVEIKKGICGDYAILTTALLMNLNCKAYLLRLEFDGEEAGHLATAIFLDQYYVLDQKLPPMDLGSYYKKWLREGKRITVAHIYDKGLLIGEITPEEMQEFDYQLTDSDLKFLENHVRLELKKKLREDSRVPSGYWEYATLKITFQNYAELYTSAFSEKIAEKIAKGVIESVEEDKGWKAFKLELKQNQMDIIAEIQLAK